MSFDIDGDQNIVAGRDLIIYRMNKFADKIGKVEQIFSKIDSDFKELSGDLSIKHGEQDKPFSADELCTSLVSIGIPISIAFDVIEDIVPLLRIRVDQGQIVYNEITTNDIKLCVLNAISELAYKSSPNGYAASATEIGTWSAAYVRRYGRSVAHLQIIDREEERPFTYEFLRKIFIPHLISSIIGIEKGADVVSRYEVFFSSQIIDQMSHQIMNLANALNLYSITYKTLFNLARETIINPPHPWMVTKDSMASIVNYNIERAKYHFDFIEFSSEPTKLNHYMSSAYECAIHLSAAILAHYGCMLGVDTKYGLTELCRICNIKRNNNNIVLWDYCRLNDLDRDLNSIGYSLDSFRSFLERLIKNISRRAVRPSDIRSISINCQSLQHIVQSITSKSR